MADRLHAHALGAAERMLGPMARAARKVMGAAAGPAVPRTRRRPATVMAAEAKPALAPRRVTGAVHVMPTHPHPGPLPQAGEGAVSKRRPAFPVPIAKEDGAWLRASEAPVPPAHPPRRVAAVTPSLPVRASSTPPPLPLLLAGEGRGEGRPAAPGQVPARPMPVVPPLAVPPRREPALPPPRAADTAAPPPPAAPPPAPAPLDEARLGRWLAEHLAEETRRPARGATGFDPRLSPGWPGTLQGPWGWGG